MGSFIVEILHSDEGGDVEQVCSNLKINLMYLRLLISLSFSLNCVYISCMLLLLTSYMLDIVVLN